MQYYTDSHPLYVSNIETCVDDYFHNTLMLDETAFDSKVRECAEYILEFGNEYGEYNYDECRIAVLDNMYRLNGDNETACGAAVCLNVDRSYQNFTFEDPPTIELNKVVLDNYSVEKYKPMLRHEIAHIEEIEQFGTYNEESGHHAMLLDEYKGLRGSEMADYLGVSPDEWHTMNRERAEKL